MAEVTINCELDPPLENWNEKINCKTLPMLISGVEALAEYICENPPSEFDEFIELVDVPSSYSGQSGKLVAVNNTEDALEFVDNVATDELVKVSANDTTPNYLLAKLAQGNGITLTETNDGGDEDVTITVNQSQLALASLGTKSHTSLTDIGTNTHPQIDTAIAASASHIANTSNPHSTTFLKLGDVPSTYVAQSLKYPRVNIGETALEFITPATLAGTLSHTNLTNIGTNTHSQIDTHIASTANPHTTTLEQARTANSVMSGGFSSTTGNLVLNNAGTSTSIFQHFGFINSALIYSVAATDRVGIGTSSPLARFHVTQLAATGAQVPLHTMTSAAHTALAASTERNEVNWDFSATQQFATGAIATQRAIRIQAPTYSAVGASVITTAATLAISGAPINGTNMGITNTRALWIESGNSRFDGTVTITGTSTFGTVIFNGSSTFNVNTTFADGINIAFNTTTGTKIGTGTTQKIGFWNATPVVQDTGWGSITNVTPDKAYNANATTLDEISDVLGTLIAQLVTYGILGA